MGCPKLHTRKMHYRTKGMQGLFVGFKKSDAKSYRYGFNGQQKEDDIAGEGNHNTALFWEYDTRLGRRWNLDPKPNHAVSLYSVFESNPILNIDLDGDTSRGVSKTSANRALSIMQNSFVGENTTSVKNLFKLSSDGVTFKQIPLTDFVSATKGLSDEQKALATGYFEVINSPQLHTIEVLKRKEPTGSITQSFVAKDKLGSDIDDNHGGGFNIAANGLGSHTSIVMNSKAKVGDNYAVPFGGYIMKNQYSSAGELLAHELLGHGLGRSQGSHNFSHLDALQFTNIYRRAVGNTTARNGSQHGNGTVISLKDANSIPNYVKWGVGVHRIFPQPKK
jgi:hypothetical protein